MDKRNLPLMIPSIIEEDITAVVKVLRSGLLVQGKEVAELEKRFVETTGSNFAVAVANGTATMHLVLVALGIGKDDEVILPAFSYIATANVIELVGAKPIFVDIEKDTFNIDVSLIEKVITPRTKLILPVHEFGVAANINEIVNLANKHGLMVLEDAACALGAKEMGKSVGTFGIAGSFSLHPRKSVTSGEGGVITTSDENLYHKLRALRNHGIDSTKPTMDFILPGFNYRMTDFQAALVNNQMNRLPKMLEKKGLLAEVYLKELASENIILPRVVESRNHTWQTFHILLPAEIDRGELIKKMASQGIGTNYGAQCIPEQTYYKNKYGFDSKSEFPYAYRAYTKGLALPLYEKMTEDDIYYIIKNFKNNYKQCLTTKQFS